MSTEQFCAFENTDELFAWLASHHSSEQELWVRIFKNGSGTPSVDWKNCVIVALCWGWIDGQKQKLDAISYLQRLTPRRSRSNWSKKNCEYAETLISEGRMQPAGRLHVDAAKADGRWGNAYSGSADMTLPADFLAALEIDLAAKAAFSTLKKAAVFSIYHSLHTAKRPETRMKRLEAILSKLRNGENLI